MIFVDHSIEKITEIVGTTFRAGLSSVTDLKLVAYVALVSLKS